MKRLLSAFLMLCLICMLMPALAEDAGQSEISGTDWLTPEDGYVAVWEGNDLLLKPVDQDNNFLYIPQALESEIICIADGGHYGSVSIESGYIISSVQLFKVPVAMTEDRRQELLSMVTSNKDKKKFNPYKRFSYESISGMEDADKLLASFPAFATENLYILLSVVPGNGVVRVDALHSLEDMLEKYGYTEADFEQDMADVAVWHAYIQNPHSFITIRFRNATSDLTLTRTGVLQLAALADTLNDNAVNHIRLGIEPAPVGELIKDTYEVDGAVWHVIYETQSSHDATIIVSTDN